MPSSPGLDLIEREDLASQQPVLRCTVTDLVVTTLVRDCGLGHIGIFRLAIHHWFALNIESVIIFQIDEPPWEVRSNRSRSIPVILRFLAGKLRIILGVEEDILSG